MTTVIEWVPVGGKYAEHPYEVNRLGWIRHRETKQSAYIRRQSKGYIQCRMTGSKLHYVHAVVAETFIGARPEGGQVNHINGCKSDNRLENLEWVTGEENLDHSAAMRLHSDAVHPEDVVEIRKMFAEGKPRKVIAAFFGCSIKHVCRIVKGEQRRVAIGNEDSVIAEYERQQAEKAERRAAKLAEQQAAREQRMERQRLRLAEAEYRRLHPKKRGRPRKSPILVEA